MDVSVVYGHDKARKIKKGWGWAGYHINSLLKKVRWEKFPFVEIKNGFSLSQNIPLFSQFFVCCWCMGTPLLSHFEAMLNVIKTA